MFQNEAFTRISDISDKSSIIAADLYCHKSCFSGYEIKVKNSMIDKVVSKLYFIKFTIENENDISLSELRDMLNQNQNVILNNSEIKLLLHIMRTVFNCLIEGK